jgi:hypothetical protein
VEGIFELDNVSINHIVRYGFLANIVPSVPRRRQFDAADVPKILSDARHVSSHTLQLWRLMQLPRRPSSTSPQWFAIRTSPSCPPTSKSCTCCWWRTAGSPSLRMASPAAADMSHRRPTTLYRWGSAFTTWRSGKRLDIRRPRLPPR